MCIVGVYGVLTPVGVGGCGRCGGHHPVRIVHGCGDDGFRVQKFVGSTGLVLLVVGAVAIGRVVFGRSVGRLQLCALCVDPVALSSNVAL